MYEQPFNPFAKNLAIVKDYFKSPTVLVVAIAQAAAILMSVITSVYMALNVNLFIRDIYDIIYQYMNILQRELGLPSDFASSVLSQVQTPNSINISFSIPITAILACVAFFIIYFKSKNPDLSSTPKAGVMILYVLAIVELVAAIIAAVAVGLAIIGGVLFFALGNDSLSKHFITLDLGEYTYDLNLDMTVLTVFFIIFAVTFAIAITIALIIAVSKKNYYKSIKDSISTVELQSKGARVYGVMNILAAISVGFSILNSASLFGAAGMYGVRLPLSIIMIMIFSLLSLIASLVCCIAEAKLALGYRKYIDNKKYGYSDPVAPSAPYSPFPYNQNDQSQQPQNPYYAAPAQPTTGNPYADPYTAAPAAPAASYCPSCGAQVDPSAPFCSICGNRL